MKKSRQDADRQAEKELRSRLQKSLPDADDSPLESLPKALFSLPYDRIALATDLSVMLAATNPRAAIELLRAMPEVSRLTDSSDLRVWGETAKRLASTSADSAIEWIRSTAAILQALPLELRGHLLKLANKQSALSAHTALEGFQSAPDIIRTLDDPATVAKILTICLELARHSVKHSNDLLQASVRVISAIKAKQQPALLAQTLSLTAAFAFRSGGTAAEFFAELPNFIGQAAPEALTKLFHFTEEYLERSGGVALQYFKAAGCVLDIAGVNSFEKWTALARRVSLQGNAASYHFLKASPQIINDLAARAGRQRRAVVVAAVIQVVEEIAEHNNQAAVECFKSSPLALSAATLAQFRDWALRGIENPQDSARRLQAYYSLESKASQEALLKIEGGLTLDAIAQTLRLYVEGLTGRSLHIASLAAIPDEAKIGDGKTIYLPAVVSEFENEEENFRLFKVLAAHAAGQIEFLTYAANTPDLLAAHQHLHSIFTSPLLADRTDERKKTKKSAEKEVDFLLALTEFPNFDLAIRLFTTIENGRIDFLLRRTYRGIRRDLDFVRLRLRERRPDITRLPANLLPFEILFQIAICGGATTETRSLYPTLVRDLEKILFDNVLHEEATVADSLVATQKVYSLFVEEPQPSEAANQENREETEAGENPNDQSAGADPMADPEQQLTPREDPLSYWSPVQNQTLDADSDLLSRFNQFEATEQDLEKGDRAFYYDEWDRELADYRRRWCRVIERTTSRGSASFVELVRSRYSGVISSVRHQFQLLRPENLRRIRGEIDGEDYDLQAVIDYALDKRSSGRIDDRLYTRKLRRERDVAVSFLLDMSSSTARTISRDPNKPYTQPGQRIIDIEKEGLVLMSEALESVGDRYAIQGFTSEGRKNVKFYIIKDFSESYSSEIERRIGGITYQNNTRLGAAIRHASMRLSHQDARTKLLIILSDGRPYDHDYGDSRYAREDTRIALRQARQQFITPFCITIDRESEEQLRDLYGEVGYTIIDNVLSLPERLPGIYSRLTT